jgi:hypothetical protein
MATSRPPGGKDLSMPVNYSISLPTLALTDPHDQIRPAAFFICRAVGVRQQAVAERAGTVQGIIADMMTGRRPRNGPNGDAIRKAVRDLLAEKGYHYTDDELFG